MMSVQRSKITTKHNNIFVTTSIIQRIVMSMKKDKYRIS